MLKELIVEAFNKAELSRIKLGDKKPSLVSIAEEISGYINSKEGFLLGERSFRDYRNGALKLIKSDTDINIKQLKVIVGLCRYIGFNTYEDFVSRNDLEKEICSIKKTETTSPFLRTSTKNYRSSVCFYKSKTTLIICVLLLVGFIVFKIQSKPRSLVLESNRYIEVKYSFSKDRIGGFKLYNENLNYDFSEVIPNTETVFGDSQGRVKIWYKETSNSELGYYTTVELYPESSKALQPKNAYWKEE